MQEVEVLTGGLPAEYGRMTGGTINAITKSGSNEFHGDVFGYDSGGSFNSDPNKEVANFPTSSTTVGTIDKQFDYGVDVGGYLMKDRLWFFGAYDRVSETDLSTRINTPLVVGGCPSCTIPVGGSQSSKLTRDLYAGKLSLALTSSQLFNFSILGDPSSNSGAVLALAGPPSTYTGQNKIGGNDFVGRYSGVFGTNWNVNAQLGRHKEKNILAGAGASLPRTIDNTQSPAVNTGGFGFFQTQNFKRDTGKLDISSFWGNHQIKFGGDEEKLLALNANQESGGDRLRKQCGGKLADGTPIGVSPVNNQCAASGTSTNGAYTGGFVYYIHEGYANTHSTSLNQADPSTFSSNILDALTSSPKTQNTSLYLQDQWKVMPNLTLNIGVRWEEQKVGGLDNAFHIDLKHNLAPRLGIIFDPANNGRSKVYANFGRFYESIPMDINLRSVRRRAVAAGRELRPDAAQLRAERHSSGSVGQGSVHVPGQHRRYPRSIRTSRASTSTSSSSATTTRWPRTSASASRARTATSAASSRTCSTRPPASTSSPTRAPASARPRPSSTDRPGCRRSSRADPEGEAYLHRRRTPRREAFQQQLSVLHQLRVVEAGGQLRRYLPELDRPERSEHQLRVRLRRLPRQQQRPAQQRPHARGEVLRVVHAQQRLGQGS